MQRKKSGGGFYGYRVLLVAFLCQVIHAGIIGYLSVFL
jgi:hypothetical protein